MGGFPMTEESKNDQGHETWDLGGRKLMKFEDYEAEVEQARSEQAARLEELAKQYVAWQQAYSRELRTTRGPIDGRLGEQAERAERMGPVMVAAGGLTAPPGAHPAVAPVADGERPVAVTDELLDHNYDGIQEYDNPTPGWWYMVWVGSIVFSVLYILVYHISGAVKPLTERHDLAKARAEQAQFAELMELEMGEPKILAIMSNEAWLDQGVAIWDNICWQCHGKHGEGTIGPNMTDNHYKNVTDLMGVVDVITNGAANGAMPAQGTVLNEQEIAIVAAYAAAMRGKALPEGIAGRPPEGYEIDPWPEPVPVEEGEPQARLGSTETTSSSG